MLAVILNGLITGLLLQLAIGPVFFYILNLSLQRSLVDGLLAVAAATIVDYFYISLAILGVGSLVEKPKTKLLLGILSSIVLILFGMMMIISALQTSQVNLINPGDESTHLSSFTGTFILTISSPLTIVFWTSLFAAKGIEKGYQRNELVIFGIAAGAATIIFLGTAVSLFSIIKTSIPLTLLKVLNMGVGVLLILYGMVRFGKMIRSRQEEIR
jgi:threonine/homoserine/homoserine lactone efflux protein